MGNLADKMIRAAMLDSKFYIQVMDDPAAMRQALFVVIIYSLCAGIGSGLSDLSNIGTGHFFLTLFSMMLSALFLWFLWSFTTYFLGTRLFRGPKAPWRVIATYGELLRAIGFACAPGILIIFICIPGVGAFVSVAAWVWMFIATVVAVREALDFTTWRAIGTCIVGGILNLALAIVFIVLAGLSSSVVS